MARAHARVIYIYTWCIQHGRRGCQLCCGVACCAANCESCFGVQLTYQQHVATSRAAKLSQREGKSGSGRISYVSSDMSRLYRPPEMYLSCYKKEGSARGRGRARVWGYVVCALCVLCACLCASCVWSVCCCVRAVLCVCVCVICIVRVVCVVCVVCGGDGAVTHLVDLSLCLIDMHKIHRC